MSTRFAATIGNGLVLARIGRDGSLLAHGPVEKRIAAVIKGPDGERHLSGKGWTHELAYLRGTNVLRVRSRHTIGIDVERRLVAIGESVQTAFRASPEIEIKWEHGVEGLLPQTGPRVVEAWPEEFDRPPLAGATRAALVGRVPGLSDRAAVTDLYARSILVIAQHHDRSGAFAAGPGEDVLLAHALDVCGERGAARDFFEWALEHRGDDPHLAWALERHLRTSRNPDLRARLALLQASAGVEQPLEPVEGAAAALWGAWQEAIEGHRARAAAALHKAVLRRSTLGLFLAGSGVDLSAHALLLLTVHALIPETAGGEDGFFEHQATTQKKRHARALYGGAFHAGMPEPGEGLLVAEVRADLEVSAVTLEVAGKTVENLERASHQSGHPVRWTGAVPRVTEGEVTHYRLRVHVNDDDAAPIWASDSDPRPGGQEFALEGSPPPPPDWVKDGICYHVMVDRFARPGERLPPPGDPTALYGGTLDGVREHLDHIASLSCNVLWLSPVHQSPSHHGYDYEDFLTVEARYGGDAALIRLVKAAHEKGMRVLLDFVPNHTGRGHHLFRDAIAKGGDAAEYYRFWQWPHYYRCFGDVISLPELDTGSPVVQQVLVRAAQHWLTAYGVDGVRCDHVAGVDPAFWVELRRGLREVKKDPLVLGEATGVPDWLARYAGRIDSIFDFDLAYYIRESLGRGRMKADSFAAWLDEHDHHYPGLALATLLDNHDMDRFLWVAGGNVDRLKLAATLMLTLPGMPVLYYGTEVGLSQRYDGVIENAEARLPMLWGDARNQDVLAHFQRLARMRRESPALRRGDRRTVLADAEVFAYERRLEDDSVTVALNFSDSPQTRDIPGLGRISLSPFGERVKERGKEEEFPSPLRGEG
jgi:cyclomaltodextrinase